MPAAHSKNGSFERQKVARRQTTVAGLANGKMADASDDSAPEQEAEPAPAPETPTPAPPEPHLAEQPEGGVEVDGTFATLRGGQ